MWHFKRTLPLLLSATMVVSSTPSPTIVHADEKQPVMLEDIKAIQAFVLDSGYSGIGKAIDCNGDGCVDVFDLALAKRELDQTGLPSLTEFEADHFDVTIGEKNNVLFTLNVAEVAPLEKDAVRVYDENDKEIAVMHDDGKDGDEAAGDGVYSADVAVYADDFGTMEYYAAAKGVRSNHERLTFYRELEDNEFDGFFALLDKLAPMSYAEACSYVKNSKEIASYNSDDAQQVLSFETIYHISGMWVPQEERGEIGTEQGSMRTASYGTAADIKDNAPLSQDPTEPMAASADVLSTRQQPNLSASSVAMAYEEDIIDETIDPLYPYHNDVRMGKGDDWQPCSECNNSSESPVFQNASATPAHTKTRVAVICSSYDTDAYSAESLGNEIAQTLGSGTADIYEGTSGGLFNKNYVTLDLMTQLSSYGVVIISADRYQPKDQGLSSYNYEHYGDTYIMLGAESKSAKNKKYSADYSNSNIIVVVGSEGWFNCRFAVGKGFFTDHYSTGALNDSFWFLNSPGLLGNEIKSDTGYAQALTGLGANAVVGFNTQIGNMANSKIVMDKVFSELTNGKTVSAAKNTLNGIYKTATILKGNSSYRLFKSGTMKTGAQATDNSDFCLEIGTVVARPGEIIDLPIRNTGTAVRLGCIMSGIAICQPLELKYMSIHFTQPSVIIDLKRQIGALTAASASRSKRVS